MKGRAIPRVALACAALAMWFEICRPTLTLFAADGGTEFILCAPEDRIAAVAGRHALTIVRPVDDHGHNVYLVRGGPDLAIGATTSDFPLDSAATTTATDTLLRDVRSDPDVEHFDLNGAATISETHPGALLNESTVAILDSLTNPTTTSYFGATVWSQYVNQPAMGVIRLPEAQQLATGAGVIVAIIDTGIDPHHALLSGSIVPGYDFTRDVAGTPSEWADLDESTVAILDKAAATVLDPSSSPVMLNESTVAILDSATASSVDVTQLPAAFGHGTMTAGLVHLVAPGALIMPLKAFKADGTSNTFDIERAIYYAVDHGAKVINMSFSMAASSAELTHAIDYAGAHGVICLASAGNSGRSAVIFPAAFRNVIGIASTTLTDDRSTFTNYGDHLVRLAAPGEGLITVYPGQRYASVSGTSFSTALVAGGAVLLAQLEPTMDQRLAGRYFDDGAVKRAGAELGDGRIDLFATLRTHTSQTTSIGTTRPPADTVPPTVRLTSPAPDAVVGGIVPLVATATDDVGVVGVQFVVDGSAAGAESTQPPYQLNWNTVTVPNGVHSLAAIARDAAGNTQTAFSVNVTVANDTTAPTVTLTSPQPGIVTGTITLAANASDDVGVASVQFAVDGIDLGAPRTAAPYATSWNSSTIPNGVHALTATARDGAGNQQSVSVSVVVANDTTAPTVALTSPSASDSVTGSISIAADASDDVGVVGVQFAIDGVNLGAEIATEPYERTWNSTTVPNGVHTVTATARDAAGNQRSVSVTVSVGNDTTAPTVGIAGPSDGATVSGIVAVDADASDDVAVVAVQFLLDGVAVGAEVTAAPYELSWDTTTVPDGAHTLTATARDAAGNQQTATTVSVTVSNNPSEQR